ncbi:hypothetical protein [Tenuibacillus multivorans]|uniref:Uncharacterized protein n=1 Tax=Tenuibacillus multivorans TaxID=237069 RepID=A0A1H0AVD5_9BACI|nr:hypothetical protein [Tenuibacillus multivorans]GEL77800.1 hypothetical protein TMU01_20350 [Tenuibacillus multivorans]SDN37430.1 hypothetical protein SAMN05216498_2095 [Tenuibacillus multivorans]
MYDLYDSNRLRLEEVRKECLEQQQNMKSFKPSNHSLIHIFRHVLNIKHQGKLA